MRFARFLLALAFATVSSSVLANAHASFELRGFEVAPLDGPEGDKSYYVGGAMSISGTIAWAIDNASSQGGFGIERLDNDAAFGTSGQLMLALFVTTAPIVPGQGFSYWTVVRKYQAGLAYNFYRSEIVETGPLEGVPSGTYYLHVGVFEQEAGCSSSNGYCLDDYLTFNERLTVSNGIWSIADPTPPTGGTTQVVEYFHAGMGHYFVTGYPSEIAVLDGNPSLGWTRTGQTFKGYASATAGAVTVYRFFTASPIFNGKSSHFYTGLVNEYNALQAGNTWDYEGPGFYVRLPTGQACSSGHAQVYRMYNNGMGGAPNHRFTTQLSIYNDFVNNRGWAGEGVVFCAPN